MCQQRWSVDDRVMCPVGRGPGREWEAEKSITIRANAERFPLWGCSLLEDVNPRPNDRQNDGPGEFFHSRVFFNALIKSRGFTT